MSLLPGGRPRPRFFSTSIPSITSVQVELSGSTLAGTPVGSHDLEMLGDAGKRGTSSILVVAGGVEFAGAPAKTPCCCFCCMLILTSGTGTPYGAHDPLMFGSFTIGGLSQNSE